MLNRLNIFRKRSSKQKYQTNIDRVKKQRREIILKYILYATNGYKFLYINETSLITNMYPLYSYSKRGV